MASIQDQLTELEQNERSYQSVFDRLDKLESSLKDVNNSDGCFLPIISFIIIMIACSLLLKYKNIDNWWFVPIYGSMVLGFLLNWLLKKPRAYFCHKYYRLDKNEQEKYSNLRAKFRQDKACLNRQIREERRRIYYEREKEFEKYLNSLLEVALKKTKSIEYISDIKVILESEYSYLAEYELQLHYKSYYDIRFKKINDALGNTSETILNTVSNSAIAPKEGEMKSQSQTREEIKQATHDSIRFEVEKNGTSKFGNTGEKNSDKPVLPIPQVTLTPESKEVEITLTQEQIGQRIEENEISDLVFLPSISDTQNAETGKIFKVSHKQDFEKLNAHRNSIGMLGEEFVFEGEKKRLRENGFIDHSNNVRWVSKDSDSFGYDILSFEYNGIERYIEVKTTTEDIKTPFYISEVELKALNQLNNYVICRVYNFDIDLCKGKKYTITKEQLQKYFNLEPITFKVNPKFR